MAPMTETEANTEDEFPSLPPKRTVTHQHSTRHLPKSKVKVGKLDSRSQRHLIQSRTKSCLIWPWSKKYKMFWSLTVLCAITTVLTETYAIAFNPAGLVDAGEAASIVEYFLVAVFLIDIGVNFHLVYYDDADDLVTDKKKIAMHYLRGMFVFDFLGVFPFYVLALVIAGELGKDSQLASYLSLLRLVKLVRLHRVAQLFQLLQYNQRVSFTLLTICRNLAFALVWSHCSACIFHFIARQYQFDPDGTWIGGSIEDLNGVETYTTALYWSVVTFTTVGYGDFSPVNTAEQIWGMIYMLLNIICQAWMIGSITLLVVKEDEKTGAYRESLTTLKTYSKMHEFPLKMSRSLKTQLKLEFNNREVSDEHVLKDFPAATRRKVLRRLYMDALMQTSLMKDVRQQFVDAFLTSCNVEIFSPGEEIVARGNMAADLYLLVDGECETTSGDNQDKTAQEEQERLQRTKSRLGTSVASSSRGFFRKRKFHEGEFLNEVGFFTESPQFETIVTKTVCKTLTLSRSAYKSLVEDHPHSLGKVLQNLLEKVERAADAVGGVKNVSLPVRLSILRAGSIFDDGDKNSFADESMSTGNDLQLTIESVQCEAALAAVADLVKMHMNKQKDDLTTRFLFAASRGDTSTIGLMCEQGLDANCCDYDFRTGLMVAAMKGNTDTVSKLLEYDANPNLTDMHGSSALYEAARNGHDDTLKVLLSNGAKLCINEGQAASRLCQAVFDGDMLTLRRLLEAGIHVDAGDYDKRTASHIAAAEGNVAALKVLVEYGANIELPDRWGNTVHDEAKRVQAGNLTTYLKELKASSPVLPS